jgi:hypothetical protein
MRWRSAFGPIFAFASSTARPIALPVATFSPAIEIASVS